MVLVVTVRGRRCRQPWSHTLAHRPLAQVRYKHLRILCTPNQLCPIIRINTTPDQRRRTSPPRAEHPRPKIRDSCRLSLTFLGARRCCLRRPLWKNHDTTSQLLPIQPNLLSLPMFVNQLHWTPRCHMHLRLRKTCDRRVRRSLMRTRSTETADHPRKRGMDIRFRHRHLPRHPR